MALGSITLTQLLVVLVIAVVLFGSKRLARVGEDLGNALRGFRNAVSDQPDSPATLPATLPAPPPSPMIESVETIVDHETKDNA